MSVLTFYKRPFLISLQALYLATRSNLSWVEPATVKLVASYWEQIKIYQKKTYKGSNIDTDLNECVPKMIVKKK